MVSCLSRFFVYRSQAYDIVAHATGEVIFGGIDSRKYKDDLVSLPIVPSPDGDARLIVQWTCLNIYTDGECVYESSQSSSSLNNGPAALLDSGTTLAQIPQDVFENMSSIFSLIYDSQAGLWLGLCSITTENVQLEFGFGAGPDVTITVAASEIMRPFLGDSIGTYCEFGFQNGALMLPSSSGIPF
jgi:hypothetical protein